MSAARVAGRTRAPSSLTARRSGVLRGLVLLATLVTGAILVLLRDSLLPARFSYDALAIQAIGQGAYHVVDPAYESVAAVYRLAGLADAPIAASLLGYLAAAGVLAVAGRGLVRTGAPPSATVLFVVAVLLSAVYLGTYSKDVFVLPIALLAVLPGGRLRWPVLTAVAIIAYAVTFRTYWVVVLALWLGLQLVLRRWRRPVGLLLAMLLASVLLAAAIGVALGESADLFRSTTNEGRIGSDDAASAILPFIGGGTVLTGLINTPLALLSLLAPVPLLLKGGAYFLVLATVLTAFWTRTGVAVHRVSLSDPGVAERSRIALLLAFVIVQALFEPDYGSALRHLTPLLPIAVLLWTRRRVQVPAEPRSLPRLSRRPRPAAR